MLRGIELQRHAVDAIAQARWRRPIRKYVTEVTATTAAVHFCARHPVAAVDGGPDRTFDRREEAWPARAAFEFPVSDE